MKITLFFINWNDSFYIPFIKEHYGKFCNRIVMYDNHSDDESWEMARNFGFEIRTFGYMNRLDDQEYLNIKNHCWKEEKNRDVDYVIVCDADEFLVLDKLIGTAPKVKGYNMISDKLPKKDIFEINTGEYSESYSKQAIFSPKHIDEINFVHGCHKNHMTGTIVDSGFCRLFHFRQIGGVQRLLDRHAKYRPRLSKFNLKFGLGHHYGRPDWTPEKIAEFEESKRNEWKILTSTAEELW